MHHRPQDQPDHGLIPFALTTCLLLSACGSRGALGGQDLGPLPDTSSVRSADQESLEPPGCAIGIRVDECCSRAQPVSTRALHQPGDPCLVPYVSSPHLALEIPQECHDRWPEGCWLVNCTWTGPLSRLVELSPAGECRWKSECDPLHNTCNWGADLRDCCGCGHGIPADLPPGDPCVVNISRVWESWPNNPPGCANACPTGFEGCDKFCYNPPPGIIPCKENPRDPSLNQCGF